MPPHDVYIAALGKYLPTAVPVSEALASGHYDSDWAVNDQIESVMVEQRLSAPEMAVLACRQALERSGHTPEEIGLLLYATTYRQGPEGWSAPSYVERLAVGSGASAIEIGQGCNGMISALSLAVDYLRGPRRTAALIASADRFDGDLDRWMSNRGMVFGDGASALVVSKRPGVARLLSLAISADSTLEQMHRGDGGLVPGAQWRGPIDMELRKVAFLRHTKAAEVRRRFDEQVASVVDQALKDANVKMDDISIVLLSNLGRRFLDQMYLTPLGIPVERTAWGSGRHIGHLANSDQFVALEHQLRTGGLHAGDRVLIVGMGVGFTWGAVVLEILGRPEWGS